MWVVLETKSARDKIAATVKVRRRIDRGGSKENTQFTTTSNLALSLHSGKLLVIPVSKSQN